MACSVFSYKEEREYSWNYLIPIRAVSFSLKPVYNQGSFITNNHIAMTDCKACGTITLKCTSVVLPHLSIEPAELEIVETAAISLLAKRGKPDPRAALSSEMKD